MSTQQPEGNDEFPLIDENNYPVWKAAFPSVTRKELLHEDLSAGRSVTGLLIAIVTAGVLLGLLGVVLSF